MKVILRPTGRNAWSGLIKYRNCYEDLGSYFTRSGRLYTGLTKADETRLGDRLGLDLSPNSEFWKTFHIRTATKDLFLDTEDPMDELRYLFLKNHKRVADSIFQKKSTANFVIINKDEEAKKANLYNKIKRRAISEFDKLTRDEVVKSLRLYGNNAENVSADVAENMLFDIVEGNPQKFLDLWVDNTTRDTEFLIQKAIASNVLRKVKTTYKYGSDVIGNGLEEAIDYLNAPINQDIKLAVIQATQSKAFMPEVKDSSDERIEKALEEADGEVAKKTTKAKPKKKTEE